MYVFDITIAELIVNLPDLLSCVNAPELFKNYPLSLVSPLQYTFTFYCLWPKK